MKQSIQRQGRILPAGLALLLFFVACGRFPVHSGLIRASMLVLFQVAIGLIVALSLWHFVNKWVAMLLALATFSSVYPFHGIQAYMAFTGLLFGCIWYGIIVLSGTEYLIELLLGTLCIIGLLNAVFAAMQAGGIPTYYSTATGEPIGLMANKNTASALMAFCFPAFLRPRWIWGLIPLAAGLIITKTVGGILAVGAGLIFLGYLYQKLILSLIVAVAGITLYCFFVDSPGFERWPVWVAGFDAWINRPLTGYGLGHWKLLFLRQLRVNDWWWAQAHNEFLQGLVEMGIGFAFIISGYLVNIARRFTRKAILPTVALVVIVTNAMVYFPFHLAVPGMIAATWLAILEVSLREPQFV